MVFVMHTGGGGGGGGRSVRDQKWRRGKFCQWDGYRGCNKFGQGCDRRHGNVIHLARGLIQITQGNIIIHPPPEYMITWLKLTALIGLMGKVHPPFSLSHSLSL